jgi:hypothetical protein
MNISEVSQDIAVPALSKRQVVTMKFRLAHKERLTVERKQRYLANLEEEKAYQRKHYENHKETIRESQHDYYFENKDAISEKQAEKFKCACGGRYTRSNKLQHERMNIHIRSLEINEIIK